TITWQGPGDAGFGTYHADFSATTDLSLDNLLFGTSGNDALNGRAGADIMAGGIGDDTYYVDNAGDQVQENANAGNDVTISTITYQLTANVENLILRGEGAIDGLGNELNNRIFGNDAGNHLYGGAGSDDLRGMGGNDFLNGNSGADLMLGGLGDDTYSVETVGDRAIEYAGEGTDTVRASVAFTLGANVENLTLVGSGDLIGRGNDLANVLTGNAGANVLVGLGGNDRISGGAGADRMYGGMGDDTFYVDDINDKVLEAGGEGNDRVYSSVTFWVYNQSIETVILTGTTAIDGNGNSLNNSLFGNAGANHLNGASGDDKLDGGLGNDSLTGGGGSDIFFFSLNTGQDVISDFRAPGNDRINLHAYTGMEVTISQSGADTLIDLGGGNMVTVLNASQADVSSHIIW
ncbi:MAG: calcium-binding protein, partial [Asticcacaulis sp.]|nr:calcium-binding protein [Asticcacaulis sp.]